MNTLVKRIKRDPLSIKHINFELYDAEIPKEVALCKNLQLLNLSYTDIKKIPDFVTQLPNLKAIHALGQKLSSRPKFTEFPNLIDIGIHCSKIKELDEITSLTSIEKLIISGKIKNIPESIENLKNLKELNLFGLPITQLPTGIIHLPKLTKIEISTDGEKLDFEHALTVLQLCEKLKEIKIHTGRLKLSQSISRIPQITKLDLQGNGLTKIPEELFELVNLTELNLGINNLKEIPKGIGNLKKLKVLKINSNWTNKFDATNLMSEIHLLENLQVLHLWSCQSVKKIPESIFECKKLKELDLDNNLLEDLPESIYKMKWLKKLRLTTNNIKKETKEKLIKELPETKVLVD